MTRTFITRFLNFFRQMNHRFGKNFNPLDPQEFIRHVDNLKIAPGSEKIHLNLWGEGWYGGAINLNAIPTTSTTGLPDRPIPNLIIISEPLQGQNVTRLPIKNQVADIMTSESSPTTTALADEMARIIKPGGKVRLGHPHWPAEGFDAYELHHLVASRIGGSYVQETRFIDGKPFVVTIITAPFD